ncbi:MAG: galactose-1-phosphate uridylyltransferase [Actinomycetota bacterium]|nr:galactose-1-phosphate uridylyltransferase [Actinomycetota bacterium]
MSTLRRDQTTASWEILAPSRRARPHTAPVIERTPLPERDPTCPFCPGNEEQTPPEIARRSSASDWIIRVVPNRFPALGDSVAGDSERDGALGSRARELFRSMPGEGSHEVVVETPQHDVRLDEMPEAEVARVIETWRSRYRELIGRPEVRAVAVFKNFGPLAGTSLVHAHSQIIATPVPLPGTAVRIDTASRYRNESGGCVYEDLLAEERAIGTRMVDELDGFSIVAPFASGAPFECWIVPNEHGFSFGDIADQDMAGLARAILRALGAIRYACDDPDFNVMVYSAVPGEGVGADAFHWFVKILPKLATPAGFELGSAMSINTVAPEDAAVALRWALQQPGLS